jgi:hypothetical protein
MWYNPSLDKLSKLSAGELRSKYKNLVTAAMGVNVTLRDMRQFYILILKTKVLNDESQLKQLSRVLHGQAGHSEATGNFAYGNIVNDVQLVYTETRASLAFQRVIGLIPNDYLLAQNVYLTKLRNLFPQESNL